MSTDTQHEHRTHEARTHEAGTHEVRADVVMAMSADDAQERLQARLLAGRHGVVEEAVPVRLVVGPSRDMRLPGKQVRGEVLPPHEHGHSVVFPLHWEAVGVAAAAYPVLEANIAITPIDDASCLLSFLGHYTPPLGTLGALADRAAMSHVADATAEAVVTRLAAAIRETPPRPAGV